MTDTPRGLIAIEDEMLALAAKIEAREKGVTANAERIIHAWRRTPRWYA